MSKKIKLLFRGPCLTASGYGERAREILAAILEKENLFDISIAGTSWGNTSFLLEEDLFLDRIRKYCLKYEHETNTNQNNKYDLSVNCTIPNEFDKNLAKINIGITAGIETDRVSSFWISKANEMIDLLVVPSTHSARGFSIVYQDPNGNNQLKLQKPMVISPEGVNTAIFNTEELLTPPSWDFSASEFLFMFAGLAFERGFGEDRKNASSLVKWFCETFKDNPDVGLVLKVGMVNNSLLDKVSTENRIRELKQMAGVGSSEFPKIYLIHGRLTEAEMASLYKHPKVKCFVSLHHGEGFGRTLLEAAACGLPVMATNWSGNVDFLHIEGKKRFIGLDYDLKLVPQSAVWPGVLEQNTNWAYVKEDDVKFKLKKFVASPEKPKEWALELATHVRKHYDKILTGRRVVDTILSFYEQYQNQEKTFSSPIEAAHFLKSQLNLQPGQKTLLYTMPMSAGDVTISTAVVAGLKKKFPEHLIFFATQEQYFSLLQNNPHIFQTIRWENWMADVPFCEKIFTEVFTPNLAIQTVQANWVKGGKGRKLVEEMAAQCQVNLGEYFIHTEMPPNSPIEKYIVFNPGSGQGQWEARNYLFWPEILQNISQALGEEFQVVQVGLSTNPLYEKVLDFRGKTSYSQLAGLVSKSVCVLGIDSLTSHLAAVFNVPQVSLYGSSYANSTGPVYLSEENQDHVLLETSSRYTCEKACYKYTCIVNKDVPCVNEISPKQVVGAVLSLLRVNNENENTNFLHQRYVPHKNKLHGYTTVYNASQHDFPFQESIRSMLGICDSVTVVDGKSEDNTWEILQDLAAKEPKLKLYQKPWDWQEPGIDGIQKAFARAMITASPQDFIIQMDSDEILDAADYDKLIKLLPRFPRQFELMHLPIIELWGMEGKVRTDHNPWKWRVSRNNFRITQGIHKQARVFDEKTGRVYAKKNMCDGCSFIDIITGEFIPQMGFYSADLHQMRQSDPIEYGKRLNEIFQEWPSIWHFSWFDIERKIRHFKNFWNKCWAQLYWEDKDKPPQDRFPDVISEEDIKNKAQEIYLRGGEHVSAPVFQLSENKKMPEIMNDWVKKRKC